MHVFAQPIMSFVFPYVIAVLGVVQNSLIVDYTVHVVEALLTTTLVSNQLPQRPPLRYTKWTFSLF